MTRKILFLLLSAFTFFFLCVCSTTVLHLMGVPPLVSFAIQAVGVFIWSALGGRVAGAEEDMLSLMIYGLAGPLAGRIKERNTDGQ